MYLLLVFAVLS